MENIHFRKMLTDIAQIITENDLKAMKFNCSDFIPKRRQEDIESGFDLWEALEERDKLTANDTTFLKYLLEISSENRTDLLNILGKYELERVGTAKNPTLDTNNRATGGNYQVDNSINEGEDLRKEIEYVSQNIGRFWKNMARSMNLTEIEIDNIREENRSLQDMARKTLYTWQSKNKDNATKESLIKALYKCRNVELAELLESEEY